MKTDQNHLNLPESQMNPELNQERKELWKIFGREMDIGKQLFSLYRSHQAPKIDYPKPKQKTGDQLKPPKEKKQCPQATKIEYPPINSKQYQPIAKINFVPKKKNYEQINKEMENFYAIPQIPTNKGVDRKGMIEKLQKKFNQSRGALPKGAELPKPIYNEQHDIEDEERIKLQVERKMQKNGYLKANVSKSVERPNERNPIDECNLLFDQIMEEIEERQKFLEEIQDLPEQELKERVKKEIVERVSELQKVTQIKQKLASKQQD